MCDYYTTDKGLLEGGPWGGANEVFLNMNILPLPPCFYAIHQQKKSTFSHKKNLTTTTLLVFKLVYGNLIFIFFYLSKSLFKRIIFRYSSK